MRLHVNNGKTLLGPFLDFFDFFCQPGSNAQPTEAYDDDKATDANAKASLYQTTEGSSGETTDSDVEASDKTTDGGTGENSETTDDDAEASVKTTADGSGKISKANYEGKTTEGSEASNDTVRCTSYLTCSVVFAITFQF